MALTWSVSSIPNHERVTTAPFRRDGKTQWHPATEALVWLSVHCGFSTITEKNVDDVAERIRIWEHYIGAPMRSSSGPLRVSMDDIRDHIGLSTNVTTLNQHQFWAKVRRIMESEARLGTSRIDVQIRRSYFQANCQEIAADVYATTGNIDTMDQIWEWFETATDLSVPNEEIAAQVAQSILQASD